MDARVTNNRIYTDNIHFLVTDQRISNGYEGHLYYIVY